MCSNIVEYNTYLTIKEKVNISLFDLNLNNMYYKDNPLDIYGNFCIANNPEEYSNNCMSSHFWIINSSYSLSEVLHNCSNLPIDQKKSLLIVSKKQELMFEIEFEKRPEYIVGITIENFEILRKLNITYIKFHYQIIFRSQICEDFIVFYIILLFFVLLISLIWIILNCRLNQHCEVMNKCFSILLIILNMCIFLLISFFLSFSPGNFLSEVLQFLTFIISSFYDSLFVMFSLYVGFGLEIVKSNFCKDELTIFTITSTSYYLMQFWINILNKNDPILFVAYIMREFIEIYIIAKILQVSLINIKQIKKLLKRREYEIGDNLKKAYKYKISIILFHLSLCFLFYGFLFITNLYSITLNLDDELFQNLVHCKWIGNSIFLLGLIIIFHSKGENIDFINSTLDSYFYDENGEPNPKELPSFVSISLKTSLLSSNYNNQQFHSKSNNTISLAINPSFQSEESDKNKLQEIKYKSINLLKQMRGSV